jgi:hypothetical protein
MNLSNVQGRLARCELRIAEFIFKLSTIRSQRTTQTMPCPVFPTNQSPETPLRRIPVCTGVPDHIPLHSRKTRLSPSEKSN